MQALKFTNYRSLTALMKTGIPGPEGSGAKLHWSEQNQRLKARDGGPGGRGRRVLAPPAAAQRGNTIEAGPPRSCATSSPSACSASGVALMQFAFTEEQELLRREAREALGNGGWSREDIAAAELGFVDQAILYEEAGRANSASRSSTRPDPRTSA